MARPVSVTEDAVKQAIGQLRAQKKGVTLYGIQRITNGARNTIQKHCDAIGIQLDNQKPLPDIDDPRLRRAVELLQPVFDEVDEEHADLVQEMHASEVAKRQALEEAHAELVVAKEVVLDEKRQELVDAADQIKTLKFELAAMTKDKEALADELTALQARAAATASTLAVSEKEVALQKTTIASLKAHVASAKDTQDQQKAHYEGLFATQQTEHADELHQLQAEIVRLKTPSPPRRFRRNGVRDK